MSHDRIAARPLVFAPLAWLKFQFLCHAGPTEVAGFGLSHPDEPLYLEDILLVSQRCTLATVALDDEAVADLFDVMADTGIPACCFGRIWLHTHPGASVTPSGTDEETFARVFGHCDWAIMAILGRTGRTSARLRFHAGPGAALEIPTAVDWVAWPSAATASTLTARIADWQREYATLVNTLQIWEAGDRRGRSPIGAALPTEEPTLGSSLTTPSGDLDDIF
jgi:proteasome lid subunit RPN8/RPN11